MSFFQIYRWKISNESQLERAHFLIACCKTFEKKHRREAAQTGIDEKELGGAANWTMFGPKIPADNKIFLYTLLPLCSRELRIIIIIIPSYHFL